jgi:hypothetical protein
MWPFTFRRTAMAGSSHVPYLIFIRDGIRSESIQAEIDLAG